MRAQGWFRGVGGAIAVVLLSGLLAAWPSQAPPAAADPSLPRLCSGKSIGGNFSYSHRESTASLWVPAGAWVTMNGAADVVGRGWGWEALMIIEMDDVEISWQGVGNYHNGPNYDDWFGDTWQNKGESRDVEVKVRVQYGPYVHWVLRAEVTGGDGSSPTACDYTPSFDSQNQTDPNWPNGPSDPADPDQDLSVRTVQQAWVGDAEVIVPTLPTVIGSPVLPSTRSAIIAGPNTGASLSCVAPNDLLDEPGDLVLEDRCGQNRRFNAARLWYESDTEGDDLVRIWDDVDDDGSRDPNERQMLVEVQWRDDIQYAALGDSYSSGEGLYGASDDRYVGGHGNLQECHRSTEAYSGQLRLSLDEPVIDDDRVDLSMIACTSALTYNIVGDDAKVSSLADITDMELRGRDGPSPVVEDEPRQNQSLAELDTPSRRVDLVTLTVGGNDLVGGQSQRFGRI